jgi:tRNA (guanine37-N1)-methyltransferase
MRVDILTLFPELFGPFLKAGIMGRAVESGKVQVMLHDLREHGEGPYRKVDDAPYGGGAGMVLLPGPLFAALDAIQAQGEAEGRVVLLSPQGRRLDQAACRGLAALPRMILVCGRYEGVDERFVQARVDEEISIGDYVLCGGELPAMVVAEAVARLLPGVLGDPASAENDSFSEELLDHPHYTRPEVFAGMAVPEVLRSGNHAEIARWRREMAEENTRRKRPDLVKDAGPGSRERSGETA